jgi:hypothetical protein
MKHPDLINEFPDETTEVKVRHFWKQLKKEDDLQLSLFSWLFIFVAFILVLVAMLGAAWIDLNPIPVTLTFAGVCAVLLWRSWLWRSAKAVCRWFVKNW